jgi:hypothetical protein
MRFALLTLVALACSGDPSDGDPDKPPPGDDDDTVPSDTTTPIDTTDTVPVTDAEVRSLDWRLHPDHPSLVYVSWVQDSAATVHVEFSFDPGEWRSSPSFGADAGENEQLLVGIPYETEAEWRVVLEGGNTFDGPAITTAELPEALPIAHLEGTSDPSRWQPGANYLLTSINSRCCGWTGGDYWTFIVDRQARVVWANPTPSEHWTLFAQVAVTGDRILWDEQTYWADFFSEGADSTVHSTWLDEEIEVIATPGLHHEFVQLPDGTLTWGSQFHGGGEALVEKAPGQADETVIWAAYDDWPGCGYGPESNGLFYDVASDSYLYSWYTNSSIVQVSRTSASPNETPGESLWWAGNVNGGFTFDPPPSQFYWQHGVSYTDAGTLLVSSEFDGHTWLLEYEVDDTYGQLHWVWGSDSGVLADTNGHAWRLANGNTLHVVGSAGVIREVTADHVDVWRINFDAEKLLGAGQWIEDLYALVKPRD